MYTMGILNDILECAKIVRVVHQEGDMDEEDIGELGNEGHGNDSSMVDKDVGYERLLEQVEQVLYQGSNFSKLHFYCTYST